MSNTQSSSSNSSDDRPPDGVIHLVPPILEEVQSHMDTIAPSSGGELLLPAEGDSSAALKKIVALEAFLSLATKECEFKEFIRELLMVFLRIVECEAGSILEVNHAHNTLFFRSVVGRSSDQVLNFEFPVGHGIAGRVAESKLPVMVENVVENKDHLKAIEKSVGFEAKNLIALPIVIRGKVYGVLELLNRHEADQFSTLDLEMLTYLCQMAAKSIEIRFAISWTKNESKTNLKEAA